MSTNKTGNAAGCIGPTFGNEYDACPCDVADCSACKPRRAPQSGGVPAARHEDPNYYTLSPGVRRALESGETGGGVPATGDLSATLEIHNATALVFGYNELARKAQTLEERIFFRLARDAAEEMARKMGAKIERAEDPERVIVTLREAPRIELRERDVVLMREALSRRATPTEGLPLDGLIADVLRLDGEATPGRWEAFDETPHPRAERFPRGGETGWARPKWIDAVPGVFRLFGDGARALIARCDQAAQESDARLIATYRTAAPVLARALLAARAEAVRWCAERNAATLEKFRAVEGTVKANAQVAALTQEVKRLTAEVEVLRTAGRRLLGVAMTHKAIPREMAAPVSAFDELRRVVEKEAGQ